MKILVTGASGFIGSALAQYLSSAGRFEVIGMVRSKKLPVSCPEIEYRLGEISSCNKLQIDLADIDVIVHAAGRAHIVNDLSLNPIEDFRRINTSGTLDLARLAVNSGVKRFIFLSSIKVNGNFTDLGSPFSVDSMEKPIDAYGISKYEAEVGLGKISHSTDMEITIIRPPLVYGKGVKGNFSSLVKLLSARIPLPLASVTNNRRSMVGLDNLLNLIEICVDHPNAANQTFFVSDNVDVSTSELLRLLGNSIGKPAVLIRFPVIILTAMARLLGMNAKIQKLVGTLQVDISHTCNQLGWNPPFTLEDGLKKLKDKTE